MAGDTAECRSRRTRGQPTVPARPTACRRPSSRASPRLVANRCQSHNHASRGTAGRVEYVRAVQPYPAGQRARADGRREQPSDRAGHHPRRSRRRGRGGRDSSTPTPARRPRSPTLPADPAGTLSVAAPPLHACHLRVERRQQQPLARTPQPGSGRGAREREQPHVGATGPRVGGRSVALRSLPAGTGGGHQRHPRASMAVVTTPHRKGPRPPAARTRPCLGARAAQELRARS